MIEQQTRPKCINYNCNRPAARNGVSAKGRVRYRVHCTGCQAASYGKRPLKEGIVPFKTGVCSNKDGKLGFVCITDWSKVTPDLKGVTEVDHINGNNSDNSPSNLQELCVHCHKRKSQLSGDYKNLRYEKNNQDIQIALDLN